MKDSLVTIVMRSFNEGWALRKTLPALKRQDYRNWELIVIDSGSTDGSIEMIRSFGPKTLIQIKQHEYVPGRVLNQGLRLAGSNNVVFLNADATPQGDNWLRPLVTALQNEGVAAVFGRQIPRPNCAAVYASDYERCFGAHRESAGWDHFFSMVSSGLRKDIWSQRGFLENLQYAEDDEYTRWCKDQGYAVRYCPESVAMHSHNYAPDEAYRRSFGDAMAQASSSIGGRKDLNFLKTFLGGWLRDVSKDVRYCWQNGRLNELPFATRVRFNQRLGRLHGFRDGWGTHRA